MSRLPAPAGPFEWLEVAVTLPADVPPGEHALEVTVRPVNGLDAGSVGTHFRVPPSDKTDVAVGWPGVPIDETGKVITLPKANLGARPSEEEAPPHLKAAYREAVAKYAADGSAESLRALVEVERSALGGGSSGELGRLASAERSVARSHLPQRKVPSRRCSVCASSTSTSTASTAATRRTSPSATRGESSRSWRRCSRPARRTRTASG